MIRIVVFTLATCFMFVLYPGFAQTDTCPAIVQAALTATNDACQNTGRNQACYGNIRLQATPQSGVTDLAFDKRGDKVNLASIQSLKLSPFDNQTQAWGVALLRLQANLPDTLPGQNVTVVLFGDVEIQNAIPVKSQSDLKPMQAFYFKSGIGDAPCAEAPDSGILIQTPKGAGKVNFTINGADIVLGSTVYVQAQPAKAMTLYVLEGQAEVSAQGATQTVPAGMVVSVPIDDQLRASAAPGTPQPYTSQQVQALPVSLLERPITVTAPQTAETTATPAVCTISASQAVNLRSGPGTNYPRAGSLASGDSATPNGQAKDTAGITWWRFPSTRWVRSDVVEASGDCANLPVVEAPPVPTAASPASGSNNQATNVDITSCQENGGQTLAAGRQITMSHSVGSYATVADAEAAIPTTTAWATINGVPGTFTGFSGGFMGRDGYTFYAFFQFDALAPGTYEAVSVSNRAGGVPDINGTTGPQEVRWSCIVTVQ